MTNAKKPRKSEVISLRLDSDQMTRLSRLARQANLTASETAARLIEEGLRRAEFSHILAKMTKHCLTQHVKTI